MKRKRVYFVLAKDNRQYCFNWNYRECLEFAKMHDLKVKWLMAYYH